MALLDELMKSGFYNLIFDRISTKIISTFFRPLNTHIDTITTKKED